MSKPLPTTMRGMEIAGTGARGMLHASSFPVPTPAVGELLLRVAYSGVNRADLLQIEGNYEPPAGASLLPGLEVSGWVTALGNGTREFTIGQEVCALLSGGGYAEYVAVPASQVLPLPASIRLKEAVSLPEAAATSIMALIDEGRLKAGERVLIHGGTSGLGILMTQIARSMGAEVFATVGTAEKATFLVTFGVHPLNHRAAPFDEQLMEATQNEGVDLIIDTLGGPMIATHLRLLKRGGRMVSLAMLQGSAIDESFKMTRLLMNHLTISGATLRSRTPAQKAEIMKKVATLVWPKLADGTIKPVIDSVFPLADAEKALARMQERLHMGKILLESGD